MPSIKRSPDADLRRSRIAGRALIALALLGIPASCGEDPSPVPPNVEPDAARPPPPDNDADADAGPASDAASDAHRLTVDCKVTPCAKDLSASWSESFCALLSDGRIACWGKNEGGELGREGGPFSATARPVDGLSGAIGLDRTCAVIDDGGVQCWGPPAAGGGATQIPLPPARIVRTGQDLACAVMADGTVSCWGRSGVDGVLAFADASAGQVVPPTAVPLDGAVDDLAIAYGRRASCNYCPIQPSHAVIARHTGGTIVSWGLAPLVGRATSRLPDPEPGRVLVEGADLFGGFGGCAVSRGSLLCWGHRPDDLGQPHRVPGVPSMAQAALGDFRFDGGADRFGRGCAASAGGDVYCWGENDFGQAGDGTTAMRAEPVKVQGLPEPVVRVEVTRGTSCALGVSGRIHCWGDDAFGQRGQKTPFTKNPAPLPVELP